jgi:putative Holliday junction resolvase
MTLSSGSRVLAVDVGTKRVGIAKADPLQMFAQVHGTFSPDDALDELEGIDEREGIETLVVGWPLTEEGEEGEATELVQDYVDRITERLPDVPIVKNDERFTSEMAKDALRRAGVKQPGRFDKGRVDAAAAALILQNYLDANT